MAWCRCVEVAGSTRCEGSESSRRTGPRERRARSSLMQTSIPGSKPTGGDVPSHTGVSNISSTRANRRLITSVSSMRILCGGALASAPSGGGALEPVVVGQDARHELHGPEAELGRAGGAGTHGAGQGGAERVQE